MSISMLIGTRDLALYGLLTAGLSIATAPQAATPTQPNLTPQACEALAAKALTGGRILAVEPVAAGAFNVARAPSGSPLAQRMSSLPAFCRVQVLATPTPDSRIGIEVWLPLQHWNGRLLGTGNGGGAGAIAYEMGMIEGLKRGFAVTNTDMGTAPDINLTIDHPERWTDFGYRATHEMTRIAKSLVTSFYNEHSFRAYFEGCSTGGQQALSNAQRYPDDYDGILAGDPGNNRTHVASYFLWNYAALNASPEAKLSSGQWSTVSKAVIASCAGKDGGAPGDQFLTDPRQCHFDPAKLPTCDAGSATDQCLTSKQIDTVRRLYAGPVNPRTGERIYAGLTVGSEDQPLGPAAQGDPAAWPKEQFYLFNWSLGTGFEPRRFDFDHDLDRLDAQLSSTLNANAADLSTFARGGGKLLMYTGLADPAVPFAEVVHYYDRVVASTGKAKGEGEEDFARLFLVPGMGHCVGGPGVTDIGQPFSSAVPPTVRNDALMTLVAWTEGGKAPSVLIARQPAEDGSPVKERPVCAYPALPEFRGGDPAKSESFVCTDHPPGVNQVPASRYLN
ncbi:tannase/feruloyl esterase family alpha/beta hydrolase [Pseudomonas sp. KU26590]|uniref:tannase/feruloyl esterase family alpha/beta hydrolase n=1 Tax=Pseudomonas sp. KU26590 TaxID=2991051 RepID=UPI00223DCD38|nr:tannase/feruloyl esterase family alpha/beta hydrolase [Pseudomonas sp. KU26590]UZJ57894.1 tannase/feruloyl esterase family alpha/beta hydrolase [Pseudomonas sp. KU26590]